MKTKTSRIAAFAALAFLSTLSSQFSTALAQGTAFTYQGRLMESNAPANGIFEFEFSLYDRRLGGSNLGTVTLEETPVTNGLFTVVLDFGNGAFNGAARWLEIYARNDGAGGVGVLLTPRQQIYATPYAMFAAQAGSAATATSATNLIGTLPAGQLAGQITALQLADGSITDQHVSPAAAIADTKLATIATAGKVANSATTATSAISSNTIVMRNAAGSFQASTIQATAGFLGNGANLSGLNAANITSGTLDDARLSSNVTKLGSTIEPNELSKPYQSGRLSITNKAEIPIHRVPFTVSFNPPFATPPVVTLGLQVSDPNADEDYRATLNSITTTGFTAAVYTPLPKAYQDVYVGNGAADLVSVSNTLGVAAVQDSSVVTNLNFFRQTNGGYWWVQSLVVTNRHMRRPVSAESVSGRPAITYHDLQLNHYRYVRASDPLGENWGTPTSIIATSNANVSPLVMVGGRPAMAYVDDTYGYRGQLRFLRANDSTGASWPTAIVVATNIAYYRPSLAVIGGLPAIAFHDYLHDRLYFTIASNAAGSAWNAPVMIECCNLYDHEVSLADVGGFPAVAYREESGSSKRVVYRRADDALGSSWSGEHLRRMDFVSSYSPTLGVCDGRPYFFWQGGGQDQGVRYAHALDATGDRWSKPINLSNIYGGDVAAKVIQGRLTVMHQDGSYMKILQPFPQFDLNWSATAP